MLRTTCRFLGSPRLITWVLAVLVISMCAGSWLDARWGHAWARWYVYESVWFRGLIATAAIGLLASCGMRLRSGRAPASFLALHAGAVALVVGSALTLLSGVQGEITLAKGQLTDRIQIPGTHRLTVERPAGSNRAVTDVSFRPGPASWSAGRTLDLGTNAGLGLRLLAFHPHARQTTEWVADSLDYDGPALRLVLSGRNGHAIAEDWLSGNAFGGEVIIGPSRYVLLPIPVETMLEDFVHPPAEMGSAGVLSIHAEGTCRRIPVEEWVGQTIEIGSHGASVEISAYLPNARPTPRGQFQSAGETAKNPLLELKVRLPGTNQTIRQVAFAKQPLLTLDGVRGTELPVKFWYHHPAVKPVAGAQFVQTPSGELYCRTTANGEQRPAQRVREQDRLSIGSDFSLTIDKHLPRARQEIRCLPLAPHEEGFQQSEAAVLVELRLGDRSQRLWLMRNDEQFGCQALSIADGPVTVSYQSQQVPLGCQLQLKDLRRETVHAARGEPGFISTVEIAASDTQPARTQEISAGQPLQCGKYRLLQTRCEQAPAQRDVVVLSATHDPGRGLKYGGAILACLGLFVMYCDNPLRRKRLEKSAHQPTAAVPAHAPGDDRAKAA